MNTQPPLQMQEVGNALLDYGIIGIALLIVGYFAWHLYKIQERNSEEWKKDAKESHKAFQELSSKQNMIAEKQIEIQEKQMIQTKDFYDSLNEKVEDLPGRMIKEMNYQKLLAQQSSNNTPSP